ncbi:MerR family transcriptional regulator [Paenibacillus eucommiae]|uniref:DNA-binding transcriptional MerR regulator n=1 Tax=Paenibacillus eucommiae TaxID=1355755 RepID=A0ABS4J3Q2_9BACL|nr:MerR family transcriptional regulator [Paenibacillus eucommiae]MBP1994474.1 DNA-binding transcriptional MerR regulator [Paenibacillus eucommiae]
MKAYTAKQVTEILQKDDPQINLRTVRYYTQIGIIPPLELHGNKRVYTEKHIHYFRAILTLSLSGETLASIQEKLGTLSLEEIGKIGDNLPFYQSKQMLSNDTHVINEDVMISMSPRISAELRAKVVDTVTQMLKGEPLS